MSRKLKEDLERIYGGMYVVEESKAPTVGKTITGDLEGKTKEINKGTGPENSEVSTAANAEEKLQGDTVEKSKKGKKATSKFQEFYNKVVEEELGGGVEDSSFNDEIGDFPPAGPDEEAGELAGEDEFGEDTVKDLFGQMAEIMSKLGDMLGEDDLGVDEGEVMSDEMELGEDEAMAGEAVESTPAPDGVSKHTAKSTMDSKGVKVVKKAVSSASSGQENGGKPKSAKATTLGPNTSLKANGSGPAVEGGGKSAFES